jgi:hypothetical protein
MRYQSSMKKPRKGMVNPKLMMVRRSSSQGVKEREARNASNFFIRERPFSV